MERLKMSLWRKRWASVVSWGIVGLCLAGTQDGVHADVSQLAGQMKAPSEASGVESVSFRGANFSVDGGLDVNGDGVDDMIFGNGFDFSVGGPAPFSANSATPEHYIVYGRAHERYSSPFFLRNMATGADVTIVGETIASEEFYESSVALLADINGDGLNDFAVTSPEASVDGRANTGRAYIVFGRKTEFSREINLADIADGDGSLGFVVNGTPAVAGEADARLGRIIRSIGDVNGDGLNDLLLASPEAVIIYGRASPFPAQIDEATVGTSGYPFGSRWTGYRLRAASRSGDMNGDGRDDIAITVDGRVDGAPQAFVVFGRDTDFPNVIDLTSLDGSGGEALVVYRDPNDDYSTDFLGSDISIDADLNNDGIKDLLIGQAKTSSVPGILGITHIIFGSDNALPQQIVIGTSPAGANADVRLSNTISFGDFGYAIAGVGDINDDGIDDVAIGAPNIGSKFFSDSFVLFGREGAWPASATTDELVLNEEVFRWGPALSWLGYDVAPAGDVDADGVADFLSVDFFSGSTSLAYGVPAVTDADSDLVPDSADNCTTMANAFQIDTDNDGHGNLCDPDFNQDCVVNAIDLGYMRSVYFTNDSLADLNNDGGVNVTDLGILRAFFFETVGPSAGPALCADDN